MATEDMRPRVGICTKCKSVVRKNVSWEGSGAYREHDNYCPICGTKLLFELDEENAKLTLKEKNKVKKVLKFRKVKKVPEKKSIPKKTVKKKVTKKRTCNICKRIKRTTSKKARYVCRWCKIWQKKQKKK